LPEQFLGVVGLEAAVLIPPPAVGVIADPERLDDVGNGLALGDQLLSLAELADDLLGRCFRAMGSSVWRTLISPGPTSGGHPLRACV